MTDGEFSKRFNGKACLARVAQSLKDRAFPAAFALLAAGAFAALSSAAEVESVQASAEPPLRLYSTQLAHPNPNIAYIDRTREAIEKVLAPRKVVYQSVTIKELDRLVENREADLVVAGAGFYRRHLRDGLRDVGTLVSALQPDPNYAVGSAVVVRANRTDIQTLADLRGKAVAANAPMGFQGHLMVLREIAAMGFDADHFFGRMDYVGMDLMPSIERVRRGQVDAAVLTSCLLETLAAEGRTDLSDLRVIGEKPQNHIACRVSTDLYPHWSLLITPNLDVKTVQKILLAAHSMEKSAEDGIEWAMASDFSAVDSMYRELRLGPYEYLRRWTLERVWHEYSLLIIGALMLIFGLIGHSVRVTQIVQKRTSELKKVHEEQSRLNREIADFRQHYEVMRRAATVSQLSSLIAHELSQPIGGILLYAAGLKNLLAGAAESAQPEEKARSKAAAAVVCKIEARAQKANRIVSAVRHYAKTGEAASESFDPAELVSSVVRDFRRSENVAESAVRIVRPSVPSTVCGVKLDTELVLVNLLRNSWHEIRAQAAPWIEVAVETTEKGFAVTVTDSGTAVNDTLLATLGRPTETLKCEGLGLGLSIVRSIVERRLGTLAFDKTPTGGLRVSLFFPNERKNHDEIALSDPAS